MKPETGNNNLYKKPSMRKYIIASVCVVLIVIVALTVAIYNWEPKPDPTSERLLRSAAGISYFIQTGNNKEMEELTDEDLAMLEKLDFPSYFFSPGFVEISDIKLLEKCTNLQELQLVTIRYPEKKIPKLIRCLGKLGVIDLDKIFAIDLYPIQNLTALKTLRLSGAQINDITPLKNLNNLEELYIEYCPNITDKQVEDLQKALPDCKIIR